MGWWWWWIFKLFEGAESINWYCYPYGVLEESEWTLGRQNLAIFFPLSVKNVSAFVSKREKCEEERSFFFQIPFVYWPKELFNLDAMKFLSRLILIFNFIWILTVIWVGSITMGNSILKYIHRFCSFIKHVHINCVERNLIYFHGKSFKKIPHSGTYICISKDSIHSYRLIPLLYIFGNNYAT